MLTLRRRGQHGFTLMELLVTVTIVAVGAMLAAPGANTMITNRKVQGAAQSILDGLNIARMEAIRRNAPVRFTMNTDGRGWTVTQVGSGTTVQEFSSSDWSGLSLTTTPATAVTFMPSGLLQTGTQLSQVTVAAPVDDARTRRVNVFGGGLIRMCDPAITADNDPRRC